ncbi:hypothetical protein O6H91_17G014600 [Diphasiastrum complanatum]|uniref:Uncharacterized protein n=2 Tax=Diphasiastrum complanatum TaxID=34168 RepID=A0ACC2B4C1_DIPCM|nr:hypothetical protein O6H91_17G014500 [Diphasiastrum complanatum]KAJ7524636.1 hypothetical protein O6H91_17G014600 [Diphasiastrum complanatum]
MAISHISAIPIHATPRLLHTSTSPPLHPLCCAVAAAAGSQQVRVQPPPADYDFRAETKAQTLAMVGEMYPELMDLAEDGSLVVVKRQKDYVERRCDGYVEPEVVFLVGTAHMSRISAVQVTRVVNAVRPENVVVELCRSRAGMMYDMPPKEGVEEDDEVQWKPQESNLMSMGGDNFVSAIRRSLDLGGRSALVLRLLLAGLSRRISESAGVATGEEFRAALKAAECIGAQIVLGDRPIEITLQRAWEALSWGEKLGFASMLIQGMTTSNIDASEKVFQALQADDALSVMFAEISYRFPSLLQPLVHERDMYLAWSLKRSKAVNGCKKVVGIVGKGHLKGTVHALIHDQEHLRFRDLVGTRRYSKAASRSQQVQNILKRITLETAIGSLIWWLWDNFSR